MHPGLRASVIGTLCGLSALAHYTWIDPGPFRLGRAMVVRIGHGHTFSDSEETINARQVELFVLAPSGARTKLTPVAAASTVTGSFTPKEAGPHRVALVQDRGVSSRTPSGVKPGGRDRNPNATQSYRTLRTAVAYAGSSKGGKPVGIEFELTGALSKGEWTLQLLKHGKPVSRATIEAFWLGAKKADPAGSTSAEGLLKYRLPRDAKGPVLFSAALKDPAPPGAEYDFVNFETSLSVGW